MMAGLPDLRSFSANSNRFCVRFGSAVKQLLILTILLVPVAAAAQGDDVPIRSPVHIDGVSKVDAERLIELVNKLPSLIIIDSRLNTNRSFGYIEGSVGLPDTETDCDSLATVSPDMQQPLLFYCNGPKCGRSAVAVKAARECGYTSLYWFRGGIEEWRDKGYPLLK